jgi:uncharacterized protein (DUF1684 family)
VTLPEGDLLQLLDWKRRVFELYAEVRRSPEPEAAWTRWREVRDDLFRTHPQSPIPPRDRAAFWGASYFDYDPTLRVVADTAPASAEAIEIAGSTGEPFRFTRFATASFELDREPARLDLFWLEGYGGGVFLSFRDATSGTETYGAGRYLLDTVKGADLGRENGKLVLDFNFAYNPSCAYDPRWACPLAPPANRLAFPIRAGETAPRQEEGAPG